MWYCESCILILTYNIWKFLILEIIINGNKKIIFKDNYYLKLLFFGVNNNLQNNKKYVNN